MFQVRNSTPFSADIALLADARGVDTLFPILKATFAISDVIEVAEQQQPLMKTDEYRQDPMTTGIAILGDYHLSKPGTDILVHGDCFMADGSDFHSCDVAVEVAQYEKKLMVFGERFWDRGVVSSPSAVSRVPLIYEMAFGGVSPSGEVCEDNPIGIGYCAGADVHACDGMPLPLIESPSERIHSTECQPAPAGFEAVPPHWPLRRQYAGRYDEQWQTERAPFLPLDFDARYFQCASAGLRAEHYLRGGERVRIQNMHEDADWEFYLPEIEVECMGRWRGRTLDIPLQLETLAFYPNQSMVTLTWRGALPVNQWAAQFEYAEFFLKSIK